MSLIIADDFTGKYEVHISQFTADKLQEYIDRYETSILNKLLGVELYNLFITDIVLPVFATANGLEVSGMRVIPTTAVTGENFIGGDMSVLHVLVREELGIQIGLDGNDFTNNKKTMLLEKRIVQFASANDVGCLIKGEFDVAKAALAV